MKKETKSEPITCRATKSELESIKKHSSAFGQSIGRYLIECGLAQKSISPQRMREAYRHLAIIQDAAHHMDVSGTGDPKTIILQECAQLWQLLNG